VKAFQSLAVAVALVALAEGALAAELDATQVAAIDRYVTAEMARQRIPGAEVGIYRQGHAVLEKGYGRANLEWPAAVTPTTLMQSGSVGKQFAATAILMLVEEGKLSLEDSIAPYFPGAPDSWRPIKVKNLLSHTSGLAEYESDERARPGGEFDLRLDFTDEELLAKIEKLPIDFAVGSDWDYRNTNYVLLGFLIKRISGEYYMDYLRRRIFVPLGMTATRPISDREIIPERAAGYELEGGVLRNQKPVSATFNSTADGALYFNVVDLEKWDRALYGEELLKAATLQGMWTPFRLNDGKENPAGYGFGWFTSTVNGHRRVSHGGAWQGFTCEIGRYVDDGLTIVVLTNLDSDHAAPDNIVHVIAGLVEPALMPAPARPIPDRRPALAHALHDMLRDALRGADTARYFASGAETGHDPVTIAEMKSDLGQRDPDVPLELLERTDKGGMTVSIYRAGSAGSERRVMVRTDAAGLLRKYVVLPDPDSR
jgi:CubicO group peptidase (beta-lactamase class C family)